MKIVKHKLYPVSYLNDSGEQVNTVYTWNPKHAADNWFVGESFFVELLHPQAMGDEKRQALIVELEQKLAALKEASK